MPPYTIECVVVDGRKLGKCSANITTPTPMEAMREFIFTYLQIPLEMPHIEKRGIGLMTFLSCRIIYDPGWVFLLRCVYKEDKHAPTQKKDLLDATLTISAPRVEPQ